MSKYVSEGRATYKDAANRIEYAQEKGCKRYTFHLVNHGKRADSFTLKIQIVFVKRKYNCLRTFYLKISWQGKNFMKSLLFKAMTSWIQINNLKMLNR